MPFWASWEQNCAKLNFEKTPRKGGGNGGGMTCNHRLEAERLPPKICLAAFSPGPCWPVRCCCWCLGSKVAQNSISGKSAWHDAHSHAHMTEVAHAIVTCSWRHFDSCAAHACIIDACIQDAYVRDVCIMMHVSRMYVFMMHVSMMYVSMMAILDACMFP